ncbi:MurR/RpiR family transcriptional regulator [Bacillus sp. FJAT-49705]|uniref:MurR/RpiR family transcriptional regulator n=1 Tax=Cytobacillus citreus TaxID=2833586 RepID=A0ABS5NXY6_9BACI|nr:MurR/RpiR family transcriptional regulator [Cytobacillus citreus]MBS4192686.1 MurR/RpiR family transcriptional regulator [Cytobacillus citreus]
MSYIEKTKNRYDSLTKGLKKVGESLLSNPVLFATHPAKKVASLIDVSETMVIRFCKAIGYNGFSELQKDVQYRLLTIQPAGKEYSPLTSDSFENVMSIDEGTINHVAKNIDWDIARKIVDQIVAARSVKIVGYYQSFAYAHWFAYLLNNLLDNTALYRPETDVGITKKGYEHSVVIFSYYRYALESIRLAKEAKLNENNVIVITDSQISPIVEYGDLVLTINTSQKSLLEKGPVTFSVLNALLLHIAQKVEKLDFVNPTNKYYIQ